MLNEQGNPWTARVNALASCRGMAQTRWLLKGGVGAIEPIVWPNFADRCVRTRCCVDRSRTIRLRRTRKLTKNIRVLGNLNNQIVLRLEDIDTAQWFAEKAGNTAIQNIVVSSSTSTGTEAHVGEFSGSVSRSTQLEKAPLIPPELIMQLPNLQYFLRISGGSVYQGRIPIIQG
ncbi:hypothetical protein LMG32289_06690 [Cupriavidus pampae]|uniref:TraD/TraG TraM recognition site domain-containing protein n=1 Tax=Cupriavidus pampae TaxID=659251 RepID=A0ABM8Y2C6_9BURK|nr:hypothetical protein LMG32289_06690 [Cupriavidus pampae]